MKNFLMLIIVFHFIVYVEPNNIVKNRWRKYYSIETIRNGHTRTYTRAAALADYIFHLVKSNLPPSTTQHENLLKYAFDNLDNCFDYLHDKRQGYRVFHQCLWRTGSKMLYLLRRDNHNIYVRRARLVQNSKRFKTYKPALEAIKC